MNSSYAKFLMQKTKEDYDEIAEEFSATRRAMWPELADFDKYVREGDKVLDIGCGNGKLFGYLKEKIKNFSYIGLDVSEKLIEIANSAWEPAWTPGVPVRLDARRPSTDTFSNKPDFKVFDGINIPYSDPPAGGFDVVFCLATLPHVPSREMQVKFLENIRKVAKPGALLIVTCWNLWQFKFIKYQAKMIYHFITDKIFGKGLPRYPDAQAAEQSTDSETNFLSQIYKFFPLGNGGQYDWGDFYIPWHKQSGGKVIERYYHTFTISELRSILKKAGWKIEELGYKKRHGAKKFNLFAVGRKI